VNKAELVQELASRFEGNKRQAQDALETVVDTITRAVAKGERVVITGFGAFEKVDRPARFARNPRTGEKVRVKKTAVPKFRPGADFKGYVSGSKKLPKLTTPKTAATTKSTTATTKSTTATTKSTATAAKTAVKKGASPSGTTTGAAARSAKKTSTAKATPPPRKTATKRAAKKA
jgi:DNA-binding protein HU-beta